MSDHKAYTEVELGPVGEPEKRQTADDDADMHRMGKKQEFRFLSIAAFSVVAIAGWCYVPSTSYTAIANGGTGGIIIIFLINWFGLSFVVLSLAEMSSMAPTAGGQYHWASEFAPASIQKLLSYIAGWLSSLAWLAGLAGGVFISGLTFQGLIALNSPDYVPESWQAYLLGVMIITVAVFINTVLARWLPRLEGMIFILFVLAFLAVMVVLWVLAPRLTAAEVFASITNGSGYDSTGLALLSSQSAIMFLIVGSDATAHMAEETRHAAVIVPKAMITSYLINGGLAFVMTVTYCFVLVDYQSALDSPTGLIGLPFIQVFVNATNSVGGATALVAVVAALQSLGLINWMASTARQIFAFARDRGFPFGLWIAKVDAAGTYPINSLIFVWTFVVLITLIGIGSSVAFNAITSLQILALMSTYLVSLGSIIWRRLFGDPLPPSPWSLGTAALPINIIGALYCIYLIIFLPWPTVVPVTPASFNWASVMFVGIMLLSAIYYIAWARKVYKGPVVHVRHTD